MKLPRIDALDLRSLDVIVAEHNARNPDGLQWRVWEPSYFRSSVHQKFRWSDRDVTAW